MKFEENMKEIKELGKSWVISKKIWLKIKKI